MRKCAVLVICFLILTGCSSQPKEMEAGLELRSKLLQATACSFGTRITADYGDKIHTFTMECHANSHGDIAFTVIEPEVISGISGNLSGDGGKLTFDGTALPFELMAEDQLSPVSAPWIFLKTLRGGYITSVGKEDGRILLSIDDSYEDNALRLDIWLNSENMPEETQILYDGRRILSVSVDHFEIL